MTEDRDLYSQLGSLVRSARESRGLTQADLAQRLGLGRTSVTNIELGNQAVSVATLYELADALEVDPRDLLPSVPRSIEDEISRLSPRMQDSLAKLMKP